MACPYCQGNATQEWKRRTTLGYRLFRCRPCRRTFNERTGTPFNHLQVPTDIALLVVLWRLRYKLSLRDLGEMFLARGFTFTQETVRAWEERFAPLLIEQLRATRRGKAGSRTRMRPRCACRDGGASGTGPLMWMAIWWTRCSARHATWAPLSGSSREPVRWSAMHRRR